MNTRVGEKEGQLEATVLRTVVEEGASKSEVALQARDDNRCVVSMSLNSNSTG